MIDFIAQKNLMMRGMNTMNKANEIRNDWINALQKYEYGKLAGLIEWGFTFQDLYVLCCLHEANCFREKIEDLLEDCNFHTECGLLSEGKYEECRKVISNDIVTNNIK